MHLVTLCGSLRAHSSNRAVLQAFARLASDGVLVTDVDRIGALPHFNPDEDGDAVSADVAQFRDALAKADAVVISTPEYAHGLPGAFKNALDWLVSDPAFAGKRVAILHIDRGTTWARDSLREILRTMAAEIVEPACVSFALGTNTITAEQTLARPELRAKLEASMAALVALAGTK